MKIQKVEDYRRADIVLVYMENGTLLVRSNLDTKAFDRTIAGRDSKRRLRSARRFIDGVTAMYSVIYPDAELITYGIRYS